VALTQVDRVRAAVRDVPGFPKPGIIFKDITPLLADAELFRDACALMAAPFAQHGVSLVAAIESRGFLLAGPIAESLGAGIIPIRKVGKLPYTTRRVTYQLEYGTDALEVHVDACARGARVLVIDDEPEILTAVGDLLRHDGHVPTLCGDPEEVAGLLEQTPFDLVLTDLGMPGLSGWDVARLVKLKAPATAVAMITGWSDRIDPEYARTNGVEHVIAKPFRRDDLRRVMHSMFADVTSPYR